MNLFYIFPAGGKGKPQLIKRGFRYPEDIKRVNYLQNHSLSLLINVIEAPDDGQTLEYFSMVLKFKVLLEKMEQEFERFVNETLRLRPRANFSNIISKTRSIDSFDDDDKESLNSFLLLIYLSEHSEEMKANLRKELNQSSWKVQRAFNFYSQYTSRIEVVVENGKIYPFFFHWTPYQPPCLNGKSSLF
jgi:hypothetical protein